MPLADNPFSVFVYVCMACILMFICLIFRFSSIALTSKRKGLKYTGNRRTYNKCMFFNVVLVLGIAFLALISVVIITTPVPTG